MKDKPSNPRGRPAISRGEDSISVSVRLNTHRLEAAAARAQAERTSLSTLMRRAVDRYLRLS